MSQAARPKALRLLGHQVRRLRRAVQRPAQLAFVIGLGLLAYLSLLPQDQLPAVPLSDKFEHASAYALLTLAGATAFRGGRWTWRVALGLVVLGCAFEILQTLVPGRTGDFADALANATGVGLAVALVTIFRRLFAGDAFGQPANTSEGPAATLSAAAAGVAPPPRSSSGR